MVARMVSLFANDSGRRWLLAALAAIFVAVSVQYTFKITAGERANRSAFLRWRNQILALDEGVNIHLRYGYPNPPIMALLLRPLAGLPPVMGSLIWFYLKVVMFFLVFRWVVRLVENPSQPFPWWGKALVAALSLRPIVGDLTHGNVNIFILFLVAAALYAFRCRRDFWSGVLLALAIACKLTPILFVPYFLWKRAWTTLAGCGLGLVLFFIVVPALFLGADANIELLSGWCQHMIVPYVLEGRVTPEHQNQSLPGLLHRLLTHAASFSTFNGETYVPVAYHNLLSLPPVIVNFVLKLLMMAFALLVVCHCRTPVSGQRGARLSAEFSLILLGMLLFSERTWKHHCVTLILPFAVLLYFLTACPKSTFLRRTILGLLIAASILMASTATGLFAEMFDRAAKLAQVYGAYTLAHLLLIAGLFLVLRTRALDDQKPILPRLLYARVNANSRIVIVDAESRETESEPPQIAS